MVPYARDLGGGSAEHYADASLQQGILAGLRGEVTGLKNMKVKKHVYLSMSLLFLEIIPWIGVWILPLFARQGKQKTDAIQFFFSFISGPLCTFVLTMAISLGLLFKCVREGLSQRAGSVLWNRVVSKMGFSVMFWVAMQCVCGLILWGILKTLDTYSACSSDTLPTRLLLQPFLGSLRSRKTKFKEMAIFPAAANFWEINAGITQKLLWMAAKMTCLSIQYLSISKELEIRIDTEIHFLQENMNEMVDEIFEIICDTCRCSQRCHPPPLELEDTVKTLSDEKVPEEFICPISKELCLQPTIAVSGFTYDLPNIVRWIRCNESQPEDPITREPISMHTLYPNLALRKSILRWSDSVMKVKHNRKTLNPKSPKRKCQ